MSALLLSDLKARLNITTTAQDTILQETIDEAEALIGMRCGPLTTTSTTERQIANGGGLVVKWPIISLTQAVHVWSSYTLLTADLEQISTTTFTRKYGVGFLPGPWDVTYVAGYSTLPLPLRNASMNLALDLWRISRGAPVSANGPFQPEGNTAITSDNLPRRVESMIRPYELNGAA